jgi:hypothetical protein
LGPRPRHPRWGLPASRRPACLSSACGSVVLGAVASRLAVLAASALPAIARWAAGGSSERRTCARASYSSRATQACAARRRHPGAGLVAPASVVSTFSIARRIADSRHLTVDALHRTPTRASPSPWCRGHAARWHCVSLPQRW